MTKRSRALARIDNTAADEASALFAPDKAETDERAPPRSHVDHAANATQPINALPCQAAQTVPRRGILKRERERTATRSPHDANSRRTGFVEHVSQHGLVWREPAEIEALAEAEGQAAEAFDAETGTCAVAHVFKETADWDAGELMVGPTAIKPWRYTHDGLVALRVLEGAAWLHMQRARAEASSDAEDDADDESATRRAPSVPVGPDVRTLELSAGDWICIPPETRYMLTGASLRRGASADAEDGRVCRCAFFARMHAPAPAPSAGPATRAGVDDHAALLELGEAAQMADVRRRVEAKALERRERLKERLARLEAERADMLIRARLLRTSAPSWSAHGGGGDGQYTVDDEGDPGASTVVTLRLRPPASSSAEMRLSADANRGDNDDDSDETQHDDDDGSTDDDV